MYVLMLCRYRAEVETGEHKEASGLTANTCYQEATEIALKKLSKVHPVRLGLALNYSVYVYEIEENFQKAYSMAEAAWKDGKNIFGMTLLHICVKNFLKLKVIHQSGHSDYNDSNQILELLRDNLALWSDQDISAF